MLIRNNCDGLYHNFPNFSYSLNICFNDPKIKTKISFHRGICPFMANGRPNHNNLHISLQILEKLSGKNIDEMVILCNT